MKINIDDLCAESQLAERFLTALQFFQSVSLEVDAINKDKTEMPAERVDRVSVSHESASKELAHALKDLVIYG